MSNVLDFNRKYTITVTTKHTYTITVPGNVKSQEILKNQVSEILENQQAFMDCNNSWELTDIQIR